MWPFRRGVGHRRPWQTLRDSEAELGWLRERSEGPETGTGFDATGWPASVWVLNTMYEHAELDGSRTYDELEKEALRLGNLRPAPLGLDERTIATGGDTGFKAHPGPDWTRLRWRELANRLELDFADSDVPPCFRWFPYRSWPANIVPPTEGSLDAQNAPVLLEHLDRFAPKHVCFAHYSFVAAALSSENRVLRGRVDDLLTLVDSDHHRPGTPSNIWPGDRSWPVFTDSDLWGTKVSGSDELIAEIRADERLETVEWP